MKLVNALAQTAAAADYLRHLEAVMEELEPTQEIARVAFEPESPPLSGDDPLEQTQPIYPLAEMRSGVWGHNVEPLPTGTAEWYDRRYRK